MRKKDINVIKKKLKNIFKNLKWRQESENIIKNDINAIKKKTKTKRIAIWSCFYFKTKFWFKQF